MTHTEESLMALFYSAADAIHDSLRDDGGVQIAEGLVAKGMIDALRLAIREVLAERDMHKDEAEAQRILRQQQRERAEKAEAELSFKAALVHELLPYQDRALKAEAELALLKDDNAKWKAGILNMPMKYKRMEFNAQLQRQVERAEAECERLREDLRGLEEVRREQAAGRDCWSAEIARLRKDAERYRWLRQPEAADLGPAVYSDDDCNTWLYGDELDAAIDAAMKEQP